MKLSKLVAYDLNRELISRPNKFLFTVAYSAFLFIIFTFNVFHMFFFEVGEVGNINSLSLSVGDLVIVSLGGVLPLNSLLVDRFIFPTTWLFAHILICHFTLNYLRQDLSHGGIQIISRTRNVCSWWISKCIWNIITIITCFVALFGVLYLLCLLTGKQDTLQLNPSIFVVVFAKVLPNRTIENRDLLLHLFILPSIVCCTMSNIQMTLSLFIKPIFSFIAICCYYIAGIYYTHPAMISNYAIPVRSAAIGLCNFDFKTGLLLCLSLCVVSVLVGIIRMKKFDIL
jgi:hypothetical protein